MGTFEHKNSLRTIEAQIVQKLKNNEARPKFTGTYKEKACSFKNIQRNLFSISKHYLLFDFIQTHSCSLCL